MKRFFCLSFFTLGLIAIPALNSCDGSSIGASNPCSAASAAPISISTPSIGASSISGYACNASSTYKVVLFALTNEWYVQPLVSNPYTSISSNETWTASTNPWSSLVAVLVDPAHYTVQATEITNPALDSGVIAYDIYPKQPVSFQFGGYTWGIKTTGTASGDAFNPGPNFWSSDPSVVVTSQPGVLQLKINQINGEWQSGEVYLTQSLGYGTYTVQVGSDLSKLNLNTVAAPLFIYADVNEEIDNEYSGLGGLVLSPSTAQFVAQPYTTSGNITQYIQPSTSQFTTQMIWRSDHVTFTSWNGWAATPTPATTIKQWTYTGSNIPVPGQERVHINLWLNNGSPPTSGSGESLVINSFSYMP